MTTSPLVSAYLADLDRALAGVDPGDRAEIVDAVREHIDAALAELGAAPSQAEIAGVLRRLGSADTVASAWAAGERTTSPAAAASAAPALPYGAATPPAPGAGTMLPAWAKVLLVVVAVVVIGPLVLTLLAVLLLVPFRGGAPGWLGIGVSVVLVAAGVACLVAARRAERHRTAWLVSGIVGLVLALPLAGAALGLANSTGESSSGGSVVTVYEETPTQEPPVPTGG